jgi:hypothetical protein
VETFDYEHCKTIALFQGGISIGFLVSTQELWGIKFAEIGWAVDKVLWHNSNFKNCLVEMVQVLNLMSWDLQSLHTPMGADGIYEQNYLKP